MGAASVAIGVVAALLVAGPGLAADEAGVVVVPAPPGEASATAVDVGGVVRVGSANAQAGPEGSDTDSSASATALGVDAGPVHEEVGGAQGGSGSGSGELAGAGHDDVGHVRVLPWDASVSDRTRSESSAGLLEVVAKGLFRLDVARGDAVAEHDGKDAKGSSSSDGAALSALDRVDASVLHAESNSDGSGRTYVARLNDVEVGGDGELSECPLSLPLDVDVDVSVNCVASTGGSAGDGRGGGSSSSVQSQTAGIAVPPGSPLGDDGHLLAASSTSGLSGQGAVAATAASPTPSPSPSPSSPSSRAAAAVAAADDARGSVFGSGLARTGASPTHLASAGVALLALGSVLLMARRRLAALQPLPLRVADQSLRKLR